jgi:hypothetical protein
MRATLVAVGMALVVAGGATGTAQAASISIAPTSVTEPASGKVSATFTLTRTGFSLNSATVTVTASDGTANAPGDYTPGSPQTVTVPSTLLGDSTATVSFDVLADALDEADETFTATLSDPLPDGETLGTSSAVTTIADNAADLPPTVAVGPSSVIEGTSAAASTLAVPVTLSAASGRAVSVAYATSDGTATAGPDYTAAAGTLTIPAGQTAGTINVPVVGDALDESDESLTLTLSTPVNASITTATTTGTITDDDTATITVTGATVLEGAAGATTATNAVVNLSVASAKPVTVSYATADGTAVAPADYVPATGQATVPAGQRAAMIPLAVVGDAAVEPDEAFAVTLSGPVGAPIAPGGASAPIVIRNDDGAGGAVPPDQQGTVITKPTTSGTLPGPGGGATKRVALGKLKFTRSSGVMRFVVGCPAGVGQCKGTVTVFSVPAARSKVKALRREQQLATRSFSVTQGAKVTTTMRLTSRGRGWLRKAKTVKITAYAVCRDATGAYSTVKVAGTLRR